MPPPKNPRPKPKMARVWVRMSDEAYQMLVLLENARGGEHSRPAVLEEAIRTMYASDRLLAQLRNLAPPTPPGSNGSGTHQNTR